MTPQMLLQMLMSGQRGAAPPNQLGAPPVQPIRQFGRRAQQSAQEVPQGPMQMMGRTPQAPQTIDPRLTGKTGLSDLLLGTGLGMMAQSDTPGQSFLGNVGRSLPMGMQMRDQARQATALSDAMRGAPGSMQRLMEIDPATAMGLLPEPMSPGDRYKASGNRMFDVVEGRYISDGGEEGGRRWFGPDIEAYAQSMFGKRYSDLPKEQATLVMDNFEQAKTRRAIAGRDQPPSTSSINDAYAGRVSSVITEDYDQFRDISVPVLQNIEESLAIANSPEFQAIQGPLQGNWIAVKASQIFGDDETNAMRGFWNRMGDERTLQILGNFTGAKSNYETQIAKKMGLSDLTLNAEEVRAGLQYMRRAAIQDAYRWAKNMIDLEAPSDRGFLSQHRGLVDEAQQIIDQYGEEAETYMDASLWGEGGSMQPLSDEAILKKIYGSTPVGPPTSAGRPNTTISLEGRSGMVNY